LQKHWDLLWENKLERIVQVFSDASKIKSNKASCMISQDEQYIAKQCPHKYDLKPTYDENAPKN